MSITVGDKIPSVEFTIMGSEGPEKLASDKLFRDKKIVLFAVPGAFTPTCSVAHLPGFVVHLDTIKAKGVDTVACVSVNDIFVMDAWGKSQNAEHLLMLADGNAEFTQAIGLTMDASTYGMGERSKRYAMIITNGRVDYIGIDEKALDKSSAEAIIDALN